MKAPHWTHFQMLFFLVLNNCNYCIIQTLLTPQGLTRLYRTSCTSWSPACSKVRALQGHRFWSNMCLLSVWLGVQLLGSFVCRQAAILGQQHKWAAACVTANKQQQSANVVLKCLLNFYFVQNFEFVVEKLCSGCFSWIKMLTWPLVLTVLKCAVFITTH